jgi:hypothetical protein
MDDVLKLIDESTQPRRGKWTARFVDENNENGPVIISCDDGKGGDIVMPLELFRQIREGKVGP